jgi:hypothetical protein
VHALQGGACGFAWLLPSLCCTAPTRAGAGKQVTIKVTSANGRIPATGSTLRTVALTVEVEGACPGKCGSKSSSNSSSPAASKSDKTITESGNSGGAGSSSSSSMSSSSSIKKVNAAFRQKKQGERGKQAGGRGTGALQSHVLTVCCAVCCAGP